MPASSWRFINLGECVGEPAAHHVEGTEPTCALARHLVHRESCARRLEGFHRGSLGLACERRHDEGGAAVDHFVLQADAGCQHVVVATQKHGGPLAGRHCLDDAPH